MTATRNRIAFVLAALAGVAMIVAGPIMLYKGFDGRSQVSAQLSQEHITVSPDTPDKAFANKPVKDGASAQAQADVIWKHMMEASGGKTYAQIPHEGATKEQLAVRSTLASGDSLRGSLLSSVLAWNVANLVIGLGAAFLGLGVVFLALAWTLYPSRVRVPDSPAGLTKTPAGVA